MYRRRDVLPGRRVVTLHCDDARVWENRSALTRMPFLPGMARVETRLGPAPAGDWVSQVDASKRAAELYPIARERLRDTMSTETRLVTDTGQIQRDAATGILTVDTPYTQIATGFLASADQVTLSDVQFRARTRFATIAVTSLDGLPIRRSKRMLVVAVANARNEDTEFEARRLLKMGAGPVIAEPVEAAISLAGLRAAHALDTLTGRREQAVPLAGDARSSLRIGGHYQTIYFELVR